MAKQKSVVYLAIHSDVAKDIVDYLNRLVSIYQVLGHPEDVKFIEEITTELKDRMDGKSTKRLK